MLLDLGGVVVYYGVFPASRKAHKGENIFSLSCLYDE